MVTIAERNGGTGAEPPESLDTIQDKSNVGRSASSLCPRGGWVWLTTTSGMTFVKRTYCKTWGCLGCRDRLRAGFMAQVRNGCLVLGRCAFVTITYRSAPDAMRDAESVRRDWKELWRRLRRDVPSSRKWRWLRVVELTKKGQPHLHLVMGPIVGSIRCYGKEKVNAKKFQAGLESCKCLSHELSRAWNRVVPDTWLVHTVPVEGPAGAAGYMLKYLAKGYKQHGNLDRLGFKRRWSSSRGWPGTGRIILRGTEEKAWARVDWNSGKKPIAHLEAQPDDHRLLERVGRKQSLADAEKIGRASQIKRLKRMVER